MEDKTLFINEIFYSIQGEATNSGKPTIFIRTTGCPFRCSYCDTEYAFTEGNKFKISEIIKIIQSYKTKYITITGGEPLSQNNIILLMKALIDYSYNISIETSGLVDISNIPEKVQIIMDVKTPSSNEFTKNILNNLFLLKNSDVIKFVIGSKNDYDWSKKFISDNFLSNFSNLYFSPSHNILKLSDIADWILRDNLNVTLQLQFHKYIWGDIRGK